MSDSTFLTRVVLENYKSIKHCDVQMRPLMFLVGPNGAGKSNFLDALRFVSDALNTSLEHAIRQRGDIDQVRRRSTENTEAFHYYIWSSSYHQARQDTIPSALVYKSSTDT